MAFFSDRLRFRKTWNVAVSEWQPEIIHLNGTRPALLLPRDGLGIQSPILLHLRDVRDSTLARRFAARMADQIIATSHCVAESWQSAGLPGVPRVIHNGFNLSEIRGWGHRMRLPRMEDSLVAVNVSDLTAGWKRHGLFLTALRQGITRHSHLRGVMVGRARDSRSRRRLRQLRDYASALGLERAVRFVTHSDSALSWIAAADVLVSTADVEPFGRTVIEALALGKPVVVTGGGGPEEIVQGCPAGVIVPSDADSIATGILSWADPGIRQEISGAASLRAERFSDTTMRNEILDLYAGL